MYNIYVFNVIFVQVQTITCELGQLNNFKFIRGKINLYGILHKLMLQKAPHATKIGILHMTYFFMIKLFLHCFDVVIFFSLK